VIRLELENGTAEDAPSAERVRELLATLSANGNSFAILASGDHDYMQTALSDGGFVLEKRMGGPDAHFEATHLIPRPVRTFAKPWWKFWGEPSTGDCFDLRQVTEAFLAYLSGAPDPGFIQWKRLPM
jgi:hypothetical protein